MKKKNYYGIIILIIEICERTALMEGYKLYSTVSDTDGLPPTKAVINRSALVSNFTVLKEHIKGLSPKAELIAVVKADAYGHSCELCAPSLAKAGCKRFAVSSAGEASALRGVLDEHGYDADILVLGYTPPEHAPLLIKSRITQCIFSLEYANALSNALTDKIKVHIKLDTGMNRLGIRAEAFDEVKTATEEILRISKLENLIIDGMFTHFPRSDEETHEADAFTEKQFKLFEAVYSELLNCGIKINFRHVCNSAAAVRFPEYALDGVRVGIVMYGGGQSFCELPLKPVMSFETAVSHVHTLKKGEAVGYGGSFTANHDMKLITMPVGYADGFIRDFKNCNVTLVTKSGAHKIPLVGRICMDQCMADATETDVERGDRVVLFGNSREELSELAKLANTIDYEVLCLVSARVPRIDKDTFDVN